MSASVIGPTPRTEPSSSSVLGAPLGDGADGRAGQDGRGLAAQLGGVRVPPGGQPVDHGLLPHVEIAARDTGPATLVGPQVREEPRHPAARPGARVTGPGVGQLQVLARAGDPHVEQAPLLGHGRRPSAPGRSAGDRRTGPTRNTASHSRPLAACSDARVTPSTVGACCAAARSSSSATRSATVGGPSPVGGAAARASASETSACSASQRSRLAPRPSGGASVQPALRRMSRTDSGMGVPGSAARRPAPQQDHRLAHVRAGEEAGVARAPGTRSPGPPAPPRTPPTARWSGTAPRCRAAAHTPTDQASRSRR